MPACMDTLHFFSKKLHNGPAKRAIIQPTTNGHKNFNATGIPTIIKHKPVMIKNTSKINSRYISQRFNQSSTFCYVQSQSPE